MNYTSLSIIIPTHNRQNLLEEMLLSLDSQTYPMNNVEVLVVMDGCTDGSLEMLQGLHVGYRLTGIPQQQSGPSTARNNGARQATGDVLVFLDDDLLPEPGCLAEHAAVHELDPHALVLGKFLPAKSPEKRGWHFWEEQVFVHHYQAMTNGKRPPSGRRLYSGNFSVRREDFLQVGGFDERLLRGEDIELGFRLESAGLHFTFKPEAGAVHRGYRSFESWKRSAYLYGQTDVQLARERGHKRVLPEITRWYHRQPAPVRVMVRASRGQKFVQQGLIAAFKAGSDVLTKFGLHRLAHYGYSAIYKLQYWQGVSDELGGLEAFRSAIEATPPIPVMDAPPSGAAGVDR